MTTLIVERATHDDAHNMQRYRCVVTVAQATDAEFDAFFAEQLREYLHRHGHPGALSATAEALHESMRGLFGLTR